MNFDLLPHATKFFQDAHDEDACIVLVTGRPESNRALLTAALELQGAYWHQLVMGVASGDRVVVNDHPCYALQVKSNEPWALTSINES